MKIHSCTSWLNKRMDTCVHTWAAVALSLYYSMSAGYFPITVAFPIKAFCRYSRAVVCSCLGAATEIGMDLTCLVHVEVHA